MTDSSFEDDELITGIKQAGLYFDENLSALEISDDILNKIPKDVIIQYHLVPVRFDEAGTLILVSDSSDALKHTTLIANRVKKKIRILISTTENIQQALRQYYDITTYRAIVRSTGDEDDASDSALKRKVKQLLIDCIARKASDLHLIPYSNGIFVRIRINGFLMDISSELDFLAEDGPLVVNILKGMDTSGNASMQMNRMPNSGHFVLMYGDIPVACRLQTNPLGDSRDNRQHVNIRFLPQLKETKSLESIYSGYDLQAIKKILYKGGAGMYLLSGPVGTGKSTSIQAMQEYLRELYAKSGREINIYEIQNPIEYVDERNIQVEERLADKNELSLDSMTALRSALRSDPDVITYGEIRDSTDAEVATKACQTGLRMFSTVHAGDCIRTVNRLLDLDVSRMSLLAELKIIVCQRLIGVLCPNCCRPHIMTEEEKNVLTDKEIAILSNGQLKERGSLQARRACNCQDGLQGRIAIPEFIVFDDKLRNALLHMDNFDVVPTILKEHGFMSMWEKGLHMACRGQAELQDVIQKIGRD